MLLKLSTLAILISLVLTPLSMSANANEVPELRPTKPVAISLQCGSRYEIGIFLNNSGFVNSSSGSVNDGLIVELFVNDDKQKWMLISTDRNGVSCIQLLGNKWFNDPNIDDLKPFNQPKNPKELDL